MFNLAEIAYTAYRASASGKLLANGGNALPEWHHLPRQLQESWEASTRAVVESLRAGSTYSSNLLAALNAIGNVVKTTL
jgi:hypothetical protein